MKNESAIGRRTTDLPQSLVALVHDVELNQAGWWDNATKRIVEAALWISSDPLASTDLARTLRSDFGVSLSAHEVERLLALEPRHVVDRDGLYRLTQGASAEFGEKVDEAERLEKDAGRLFDQTVEQCCPEMMSRLRGLLRKPRAYRVHRCQACRSRR